MSESRPNLEFEPEWCSAAMLSSISIAETPIDTQAIEPIMQSVEPAAEPLAANLSDSETTAQSDPIPLPVPAARSASKSRSDAKTSRLRKSTQPTSAKRLLAALRSRRVRIVATVVSVLFVGGLIMLNWKGGSSSTSDEFGELDLAEFNNTSGFDAPRIGNASEPHPLGGFSDAESLPASDRFPRTDSGPRLPPLGLVTHADHTTSRGQSAAGFVPAFDSFSGSQGAMLTGQIEFEASPRSTATPVRPSRNLGMR